MIDNIIITSAITGGIVVIGILTVLGVILKQNEVEIEQFNENGETKKYKIKK
jgi:tetrahydromethanopterin S-methyltransferase subunit E